MSRSRRLAFAAAALRAAAGAAAVPPEIRGTVYERDRDHPVPGALVALYDAGDLLVDTTYTRDDGGFRLLPPQRKGKVYVVATQGSRSRRADLDYDPAGRDRLVWIELSQKKESRLKQAGAFVIEKLGAVVGLLVGYFFRVFVEERGAAKRKRDDFLFDLRDHAKRALTPYTANAVDPSLAEVTVAVRQMRQLVDRRSDMPDVLSALRLVRKQKGRAGFRALDGKVKRAEDLLAKAPGATDHDRQQQLAQVRTILAGIRDDPWAEPAQAPQNP
jgi:hypothetical protein